MDRLAGKPPPTKTRWSDVATKITPNLVLILLFAMAGLNACAKIWGAHQVVAWAISGAIFGGIAAALICKRHGARHDQFVEYVDPYAVVRSTATLQAHRARYKAAQRAARPFFHIACIGYGLAITFEIAMILLKGFAWLPVFFILIAGAGASCGLAAVRMRRYLREHPNEARGPAPPSSLC